MDLELLVRLGLNGQPYTIPVLLVGTLIILSWRALTWRRRRPGWPAGLLWAVAVLGYAAVTMTPISRIGTVPTGLRRAHIHWSGWGQPFFGLLMTRRPEAMVNC